MRPNNPILFNAVANTGTKLSAAVDTSVMFTGSFQATFSDGTAAGTLVIQASNDPFEILPANEAPQTWIDIANTSTSVASGASKLITVQTLNYRWIRAKWTQSGGSGTLTVVAFLQGY
jgi:hypothetical protein